jgi:hypothetical protein
MTVTPATIVAEFSPTEVRELAIDLGVPVELQRFVLLNLGEFAETEFLASYCAAVMSELDDAGVPVGVFVRAVLSGREVVEAFEKEKL